MNCSEASARLEGFFDAALAPARARQIEEHLAQCPACSTRLEQMQAVRILLRKSVPPSPSPALDARVARAFYERHAPRQTSGGWWRRLIFEPVRVPGSALAAALVVAVCVALFVGVKVGRISGTAIVVNPPPSPAVNMAPTPASRVSAESDTDSRAVRLATAIPRPKPRRPVPGRRPLTVTVERGAPAQPPLESFMVVSSLGANYSTRAALAGFEPVTGVSARVIKGGEER